MSEQVKGMKDAVMGQGGGLQSVSTIAGETIAGSSDTRSSSSKQADEATKSLGQFEKGSGGQTQSGTSVKTTDQITNQQTGTSDHLELGMRKQ